MDMLEAAVCAQWVSCMYSFSDSAMQFPTSLWAVRFLHIYGIHIKGCAGSPPLIEMDSYKFETVHNFTYLGSEVNCKNISTDIKNVSFLWVDVFMDLNI
jgi:hypothetical protein